MKKSSFIVLLICIILISWCFLVYYIWMNTTPFMILNCPDWTKKVVDSIQWYKTKRCENNNWEKVIAYYKIPWWELAVWKYNNWILYEVDGYGSSNYWTYKEDVVCKYENKHEYCEIYKYEKWKKSFLDWIKGLLSEWIWNIFKTWELSYSSSNKCDDWPLEWIVRAKDYPPFGVYCNIKDWETMKYYDNWKLEYYRKEKEWLLEKMIHYYDNWQVEYEKEYIDEENLKQDVIYYNKDWTVNHIEYIDKN